MPLEDALAFIARSFDAYLRGERGQAPGPLGGSIPDRHPEAIQTLLNLLRENRQLTVLQYDKVIKYLQDKREIQIKLEVGDAKDLPTLAGQPTNKQQAELQHRIMNILNQSGGGGGGCGGGQPVPQGVPSPWQQSSAAPPSSGPILNDPTIQKALDNLIQTDLLKKITPGNPGPVRPPQQPLFGAYAGNHR